MRRLALCRAWALALAVAPLAACEVPPCPKDQQLGAAQTPCDCDGVVVEDLECGGATCTAYGVFAVTTGADTGCTSETTTTTSSSR